MISNLPSCAGDNGVLSCQAAASLCHFWDETGKFGIRDARLCIVSCLTAGLLFIVSPVTG